MALYRRIRKRNRIKVDGPATITVASGQASVHIEADKSVTIEVDGAKKKHGLVGRKSQIK